MDIKTAIAEYYREKKSYLKDYQKLGWENESAQRVRFLQFTNAFNLNGKSILDVGCGLGNLLQHLNSEKIQAEYTGLDLLSEMVETAKNRFKTSNFICADVFRESLFPENSFDFVYASGIFNLRFDDSYDFLQNAIEKFCVLAKEAVCFNLLHTKSSDREDKYFYTNEKEVMEIFCNLGYDRLDYSFVNAYLDNDFTVIIKVN